MPAQDLDRADQAVAAQCSRQPPDQCGEHGPVRPIQAWSGVGAAPDGDLVPQHEQFDVLGGGRAAQQQDQPQHLQEEQIQQPQRHGDDHARSPTAAGYRRRHPYDQRRAHVVDRWATGTVGERHLRRVLASFRIRRIVEAPTRWPSLSSSPWILLYPQFGFPQATGGQDRQGRKSLIGSAAVGTGAGQAGRRESSDRRSSRVSTGESHDEPLASLWSRRCYCRLRPQSRVKPRARRGWPRSMSSRHRGAVGEDGGVRHVTGPCRPGRLSRPRAIQPRRWRPGRWNCWNAAWSVPTASAITQECVEQQKL